MFLPGIDTAELTSGIPEVIIVGVPPSLNGSACPNPVSDGCSQRYYELTPSPCNSEVSQCVAQQAAGGADMLLQFVWDEVLPAVIAQLGLIRGDVSITGYSLGGLTSCYAASARPMDFQRAFCMSPSVWWNSGELAHTIQSNYNDIGVKPESIVMMVGTQEGPSIILSNYDPQPWTVYISDVVTAWQNIGMGNEGTQVSSGLVTSDLVYFTTEGGVHNIINWVEIVSYSLSLMYASSYPVNYLQSLVRNKWVYPSPPVDDCSSDDSSDVAFILCVVGLLVLLPANVHWILRALNLVKGGSGDEKLLANESTKSNVERSEALNIP